MITGVSLDNIYISSPILTGLPFQTQENKRQYKHSDTRHSVIIVNKRQLGANAPKKKKKKR